MIHYESNLQKGCVKWFRLQHPHMAKLLIAVPNGGYRNKREAARLKSEGVVPGVSDLLLLIPNKHYGALGIEMKAGKGKQTVNQLQWQERFEQAGNKYVVCRGIEEFMQAIKEYLS